MLFHEGGGFLLEILAFKVEVLVGNVRGRGVDPGILEACLAPIDGEDMEPGIASEAVLGHEAVGAAGVEDVDFLFVSEAGQSFLDGREVGRAGIVALDLEAPQLPGRRRVVGRGPLAGDEGLLEASFLPARGLLEAIDDEGDDLLVPFLDREGLEGP